MRVTTIAPPEASELARAVGVVRADGLRYAYRNGVPVLHDLDLEISVGDIVALVGPNGAGKSTLLRILAGELVPAAGELELPAGRSAAGRVMLGYAPEEGAHFESLSGLENALFFARAAGLRRAEARASVVEHMDALGLTDDAARPVADYSFGARRKLLLVEALAHRPALTLLDEPFVGLDQASRVALIRLLRLQSAKRGTVVVASHDLALLPELVDRIVFIHEGRVAASGRVAELLASMGRTTRFEVDLERRPEGLVGRLRPGITVVSEGDPLVLEAGSGQGALAEVCGSLVAAGAVIRSIAVRDNDLAEAFRRATGVELEP